MSVEQKLRRSSRSLLKASKGSVSCPIRDKTEKAVNEYSTNDSPMNQDNSHQDPYKNKLRQSKTHLYYNEQLDDPSSDHLSMELMLDDSEMLHIGTTILPNNISQLRQIIDYCGSQVQSLELLFFEEEEKDRSKFFRNHYS
jgi:hypothetical protein